MTKDVMQLKDVKTGKLKCAYSGCSFERQPWIRQKKDGLPEIHLGETWLRCENEEHEISEDLAKFFLEDIKEHFIIIGLKE